MSNRSEGETNSSANGTAVIFGTGAIGRGGIAPYLAGGGLEVVFIGGLRRLCEPLKQRGSYEVAAVGPEPDAIPVIHIVAPVRVTHRRDRVRAAGEIALTELVCLPTPSDMAEWIAPTLAAGLLARRKSLATPLNILLCNGKPDAAERWKQLIGEHLPEKNRDDVLDRTGFARAIMRCPMMHILGEQDALNVSVTAYCLFVVEASGLVAPLPALPGMEVAANFEAHMVRQSMMDWGVGAALGCLGYTAGHRYSWQALADARISALIRAVLDETSQALITEYDFEPEAQAAYASELLAYFAHRTLNKECRVLALDQMTALESESGLVGAARLCERHGIKPTALAWAIVAVLRHHDPSDDDSAELQTRLRETGLEATLWHVCQIAPGEALGRRIEEVWRTTATGLI